MTITNELRFGVAEDHVRYSRSFFRDTKGVLPSLRVPLESRLSTFEEREKRLTGKKKGRKKRGAVNVFVISANSPTAS